MKRRSLLKRAAGLTTFGTVANVASAKHSTRSGGTYQDLVQDFERAIGRHAQPELGARYAQVENEEVQKSTDGVTTEAITFADDYKTVFYDDVEFADGTTKPLVYYTDDHDMLFARFDGNQYTIRQLDKIEQRLQRRLISSEHAPSTYTTSQRQIGGTGKKYVDIGEDVTIGGTDGSDKNGTSIWEGAAKSAIRCDYKETNAALQVAYLADSYIHAEIWRDVEFSGGSGLLKTTGFGTYRGSASSALGGGSINGDVFIREKNGSEESEHALHVGLGIVDGWGDHANYEESVYKDVSSGTYEIGIRLAINAAAATTAAAVVDLHTNENARFQFPGFFDFSYIDLEWQ